MILMRHPMDRKTVWRNPKHAGDLVMAYEMYMTFLWARAGYLDAVAACGNTRFGICTSDPAVDISYLAEQSQKIVQKTVIK